MFRHTVTPEKRANGTRANAAARGAPARANCARVPSASQAAVDRPARDHRGFHLHSDETFGGAGERVARKHDEVGELPHLQ